MNESAENDAAAGERTSDGSPVSTEEAAVPRDAARFRWLRWLVLIVPLAGVVELLAHAVQTSRVVTDAEWASAREEAKRELKAEDLLVFSPGWTEPLGRMHFGDELATIERMARPDVTRFPRAVEVSIRGAKSDALAGWKLAGEKKVGPFTLRVLDNPSPVTLRDDLVRHVSESGLAVAQGEVDPASGALLEGGASRCTFSRTSPHSGSLGFGPAVPAERFSCPSGAWVGVTVMPVLDYSARRCIHAPPPGGRAVLRLSFPSVTFGRAIHGHHGLYVEAERDGRGAPVTLVFRANGRELGRFVHSDGDGWKPFELDTRELDGLRGELTVDVSAASGQRRTYCFEADTR